MNTIETNGQQVGEETRAPAKALLARANLERVVDEGTANTGGLIERVMSEVPEDRIVRGRAIDFHVRESGALRLGMGDAVLDTHRNAVQQLADKAGVPFRYLDTLLVADEREKPNQNDVHLYGEDAAAHAAIRVQNGWRRDLASHALREHFQHDARRFLVRSVHGQARGFLSDKYRRLDSRPLLDAFVQECGRLGAVPYQGIGSDVRTYLRAIVPQVLEPVPGEAMVLGVEWANSDYGRGTYSLSAFVLRLVCLNGMIGANHSKSVHLGGRLAENIEFSQATYRKDTATMISATRDIVRGALGPKAVATQMDAIRKAHAEETTWARAFRRVSKDLTKAEAAAVKDSFEGPDVVNLPAGATNWRFSNALSWVANRAEDPERKAELQELAGRFAA